MKTSLPVPALLLGLLLFPLPALRAEDGALHFDGVDDYLEVPDFHTLGVTDEVTVEFWAKADVLKQQAAFMLSPDVPANRFQASISYNSGGNTNTYWDCGDIDAGGRVFVPNPAGTVGNWTHYAFVASQSGNFMKILVNGQQVVSDATFNAFEPTVASALRIGGSTSFFFDGSLDEFRVWNVARSQAEIQRDLGGPLRGDEPGLRLYFKFDNDGTGTAANNSATATGATRNGVPGGNPVWRATPARTTYVVTNANDNGPGSLRATLATAASDSGPALITFDSDLSGGTITLTSGQFNLADNGSVTIDASSLPGGVTISGNSASRIFYVNSGSLALRGLMLANGYGDGGGAIFNRGTLTLTHCTLSGNSLLSIYSGGAIYNVGTLTLTHCTLSGNSAGGGGAISNFGDALTLTYCTLSGNSAASGGAITNYGTLTLSNSIVAGNTAPSGGPDIYQRGTITPSGKNLIGGLSGSGLTAGANVIENPTPLLAPLGDYGGPTPTMALLPGSPALDAATPIPGLDTDQRGFPRSRDGDGNGTATPDIGAYEAQAAPTANAPNPIVVTTPNDELDPVGEPGAGLSLREALRGAPGGATVTFDPALSGSTCTLSAELGELVPRLHVTVDSVGLPAGVILSGNETSRLFFVPSGRTVVLRALTLTGGNGAGADTPLHGGACFNRGALTLDRCTLTENHALYGGAFFNESGGTLTLSQCTLTANGRAESTLEAGALYNRGTAFLTHCTIVQNSAGNYGGILNDNFCTLTLTNSIVADNQGGAPADFLNRPVATFNAVGRNFIGNVVTGGTINNGAGNFIGAIYPGMPFLDPLGNYGGPTPTMPPQPGSGFIDFVTNLPGLESDQRGLPRGVDGDGVGGFIGSGAGEAITDLGAVEFQRRVVTTLADQLDTPTGEETSLREALRDGADVVFFAPALSGGTNTLDAAKGPLIPFKHAEVDASDLTGGFTLSGNNASQIFRVNAGRSLTLRGLTLTGGSAGVGGAIFNAGTLTLTHCTLSSNTAGSSGGAIYNQGTMTLTHCTLSSNTAAGGSGGAIRHNDGSMTLAHCTLSGNFANSGGAIYSQSTLALHNTVVAGNTARDSEPDIRFAVGPITPTGMNLIGSLAGFGIPPGPSVLVGDPLLAPLGNYGGPTKTMALLPGSPARNAAVGSTITSDQRGFPIVDTPDIGAYEAGTLAPNYQAYIWESLPATATVNDHGGEVDYDGDHASNQAEWAALTNPADAQDVLRLTAAAFSVTTSNVTFTTKLGVQYRLQMSRRPGDGWMSVGPHIPGTGSTVTIPVSPAPDATPTYRVAPSTAPMLELAMVTVGNAGNADDPNPNGLGGNSGAVAYEYNIGKYEVTNGEYVSFLNAVDPNGQNLLALYNANMNLDAGNGGIIFSAGNLGGTKYAVKAGFANKPVVYVSFYDAMRFCNWLHNGAVAGGDTENGAYNLLGNSAIPSNGTTVTRNAGAKFAVPSENEWYKAAYHEPGGDTDNYWRYPTRSNSPPSASAPPGTAPAANFDFVVGSVTPVGAYTTTAGFYGTFDMAGNVLEWEDTVLGGSSRVLRGGSWGLSESNLQSGFPDSITPVDEYSDVGFRVASP